MHIRYSQAGLPASRHAGFQRYNCTSTAPFCAHCQKVRPDVNQKVLLTGRPGCGKTTLIRRVLNELPRCFGGFYTEEIRDHGTRVGFKVVALEGGDAVFAHVDFTPPERVGESGLDLSALEAVGVNAIRK